ncbi:hypothetical protein EUZ85_23320 [Hahella sp. KA22]|uniref:hypothetical protein n=1 Tax=Hahella sp. KA22 TaxID=1628392 RepID=UPI000FDE933D|nr:hypothetical protein [Hahella sp. KA22]AZZ93492.1 hypothetical protein ENC22_20740 [Hahella sp. KA22]QAY56866.1 hypothetical protein EUZ85_23320 [Hahella sp. KA22]
METIILSVVALFLYTGLYWYTCLRTNKKSESKWFFFGSIFCISILGIGMWLSMFWVLFLAAIVLLFAAYLGSSSKYAHGSLLKNGVFGGFWIMIPIYAQLASKI